MIEFCSELAINVQHIDMQVMHEIYDYQRYHHLFGDVTFCAILYYLGHLVFVEWRSLFLHILHHYLLSL